MLFSVDISLERLQNILKFTCAFSVGNLPLVCVLLTESKMPTKCVNVKQTEAELVQRTFRRKGYVPRVSGNFASSLVLDHFKFIRKFNQTKLLS